MEEDGGVNTIPQRAPSMTLFRIVESRLGSVIVDVTLLDMPYTSAPDHQSVVKYFLTTTHGELTLI
jgi:hypothetical protein